MSILKLAFPWFGVVFSVSRQGFITTDKIRAVMRESFEKVKVKALRLLQTIQLGGEGEDYVGQLVSCFFWVFPHC